MTFLALIAIIFFGFAVYNLTCAFVDIPTKKTSQMMMLSRKQQQDCQMEKWEVYIWLQAKLGLDAHQTHIGQFSEYMCEQVISLCQQAPAYTSGRAA